MQQQGPNPGTLKPSKLIPLEVGRHGGDKAKPLPLFFPLPLFLSHALLPFYFAVSLGRDGVEISTVQMSYCEPLMHLLMKLQLEDLSLIALCGVTLITLKQSSHV